VEEKKVMRKMTGARECSGIEHFGVDVREKKVAHPQRGKVQQGLRKRHGPERKSAAREGGS